MATTLLHMIHSNSRTPFQTINRLCSNQRNTLQLFQYAHFASTQRPKSITSLSNPNRKKTAVKSGDSSTSKEVSTDWTEYEIQLYQYRHDPRSSQYRTLMDYFNIPYDCIEVTPFKKSELSLLQIPDGHHHAPLLRMSHRTKINENIKTFKEKTVLFIPNGYRHETLQIGNVATFRERVKGHINKSKDKTDEEKDSIKQTVDELFDKYDNICTEKYNLFFHHDDLFDKFLPFLESNLSNDQQRRFFNEKCPKEQIEFYATKYAWTLQACITKSFHSCFQLMSYVNMFRKTRKWGRMKVELAHLFGGIKMRLFHKRKYCKRAETGNQPKGQAMKLTYEFLQTFNEDMPDIAERARKINKRDGEDDNTKSDIGLIGKPFHGGRHPDILDILVFGAMRGTQGLDIYHWLFKKVMKVDDWYERVRDEIGTSACKRHV